MSKPIRDSRSSKSGLFANSSGKLKSGTLRGCGRLGGCSRLGGRMSVRERSGLWGLRVFKVDGFLKAAGNSSRCRGLRVLGVPGIARFLGQLRGLRTLRGLRIAEMFGLLCNTSLVRVLVRGVRNGNLAVDRKVDTVIRRGDGKSLIETSESLLSLRLRTPNASSTGVGSGLSSLLPPVPVSGLPPSS